jgi:hypothetical protein
MCEPLRPELREILHLGGASRARVEMGLHALTLGLVRGSLYVSLDLLVREVVGRGAGRHLDTQRRECPLRVRRVAEQCTALPTGGDVIVDEPQLRWAERPCPEACDLLVR